MSFKNIFEYTVMPILRDCFAKIIRCSYTRFDLMGVLLFGISKRMGSEETGGKPVCRDRRGRLSYRMMMTLSVVGYTRGSRSCSGEIDRIHVEGGDHIFGQACFLQNSLYVFR